MNNNKNFNLNNSNIKSNCNLSKYSSNTENNQIYNSNNNNKILINEGENNNNSSNKNLKIQNNKKYLLTNKSYSSSMNIFNENEKNFPKSDNKIDLLNKIQKNYFLIIQNFKKLFLNISNKVLSIIKKNIKEVQLINLIKII